MLLFSYALHLASIVLIRRRGLVQPACGDLDRRHNVIYDCNGSATPAGVMSFLSNIQSPSSMEPGKGM